MAAVYGCNALFSGVVETARVWSASQKRLSSLEGLCSDDCVNSERGKFYDRNT